MQLQTQNVICCKQLRNVNTGFSTVCDLHEDQADPPLRRTNFPEFPGTARHTVLKKKREEGGGEHF